MAQRTDLTVVYPSIPPSSNNAIKTARNGHRYKSSELKVWETIVNLGKKQKIKKSVWYGLEVTFQFPLYNKTNPNPRKKDLDNMLKYAIDGFMKNLETYKGDPIDDCHVSYIGCSKVDGEEEQTTITIYVI